MADRLDTLIKTTDAYYIEGSPLLLEASALYKDNASGQCIAQMKWKNLEKRTVKAIMIELDEYDVFNQKLEPQLFQYDNLSAVTGAIFGEKTPVLISNTNCVRYDVILKAVSFNEGDSWLVQETKPFVKLPNCINLQLEGEMLDQYKRELTQKGIQNAYHNMPQTSMGLWQCGCGSWQLTGTPCLKCKATNDILFEAADLKLLSLHLNEYKEEQERIKTEEEKRAAMERIAHEKEVAKHQAALEASRKEAEERAAIAKRKKKRVFSIVGIIAVAMIIGVIVVTRFVIPNGHYVNGEKAYVSGKYLDAYQAYIDAGNFKDAPEKARQSAHAQGDSYRSMEDYEHSYEQYVIAEADTEAKQVASLQADKLYKAYDYSEAARWYHLSGLDEKAKEASLYWDSVCASEEWLHYDIQSSKKYIPNELPKDIYIYCLTTGKYSSKKQYGIIRIGEQKWVSNHQDYTGVKYYPDQHLIIASTDTMCTLIDVDNNTMVDVADFQAVESVMNNGIVCYTNSRKLYGFIRKDGKEIASPQFSSISWDAYWGDGFSEGLLAVEKDGAWGYIDESGNVVVDFEYTDAESFSNGYAKVKMNAHKVKEGNIYVSYDDGWGLIDRTGKRIIEPNWDYIFIIGNSNQPEIEVRTKDSKYGLFDINGNVIYEPIFEEIGSESEGLRFIESSALTGWFDSNGVQKINVNYSNCSGGTFINGCAILNYIPSGSHARYSLVLNTNAEILWKGQDEDWDADQDDEGNIRIYAYRGTNSVQYYSTDNGRLIPSTKEATSWGKVSTEQNDDKTKVNLETPFYQQFATVYDFSENAIARVALNKKGPYGFVTNLEQIVVDPIYDDARDFHNAYAVVKVNDKWGCIDANGEMVIEAQYSDISSVSSCGTLFVSDDKETYSLIDLTGNIILSDITEIHSAEYRESDETPVPGESVFIKTRDASQWKLIDAYGAQVY